MSKQSLTLTGVLLAACHALAAQAADPATIARSGAGAATACANCHGAQGEGQSSFPRLAGLDAGYLARQLDDFASDRRANAVMGPIAKALSTVDRRAMAAYYAGMSPPASTGAAPPASAPGGRLATRGEWTKGVPGCVQCHGPGGVGVGAAFPAIAAQSAGYIAAQLKAFRDGTRRNDPQSLMRTPASKLTDEDIDAVAAWFAAQPARTGGRL
ncbi:MAG TPA: c-type cytochrome [Lysobacter sp.]